jgi:CRP-like cAMP-binding protein
MLLNILTKLPLFEGLSDQQAGKLIQFFNRVDLNPNDILMQEGQQCTEMHLLLDGKLNVLLQQQKIVAATMENVGVIGEIEVLLNHACFATVKAEKTSKLLKISKQKLTSIFGQDMEIELKIYRNLCKILSEKLVNNNSTITKIKTGK